MIMMCIFAPILNPLINRVLVNYNVVLARNNLIVHFISVGQGDAVAINLPDGKTMIIDSGRVDSAVTFTNYIDDYVLARDLDKKLDYVVFTHSDNDHVGGGLRLLNNYEIGTIYVPKIYDSSQDYLELKEHMEYYDYNTKYHISGTKIENDGYLIEFFGPVSEDEPNENCPLIKISYQGFDFLFTGDISSETERIFVDKYGVQLDCDVLKVAHHGSKYSTSLEFLLATTPEMSVISCGKNGYGHPTDTVINNLKACNSDVLRTDTCGNIVFSVNGYGMDCVFGEYILTNVCDYRIYLLLMFELLVIDYLIDLIKCKVKLRQQKTNED